MKGRAAEHLVMFKTSEGLNYVYPDLAIPASKTIFLEHLGGLVFAREHSYNVSHHRYTLRADDGMAPACLAALRAGAQGRQNTQFSSKCFTNTSAWRSPPSMHMGTLWPFEVPGCPDGFLENSVVVTSGFYGSFLGHKFQAQATCGSACQLWSQHT